MKKSDNNQPVVLKTNGLVVPRGFPVRPYEIVYQLVAERRGTDPLYEHHAGAWNALAYRYRTAVDSGDTFVDCITVHGATPPPEQRYLQERVLFEFFSSGFSVFESAFYGLYTIGALIVPASFPLSSAKDQQSVSPVRARDAFTRAFPEDPILTVFSTLFGDTEYQQWREIRNVLTHRTAPGRRVYVALGSENTPATEWKLNDRPLDQSITSKGLQELSRLLDYLLTGTAAFAEARLK